MSYQRHAPAEHLRDIVEHYWSITSPAPPRPVRAVLVPNGRATLQFCLADAGVRIDATGNRLPNHDVLLPATVAPAVLEQTGRSHYAGIQFTPWGTHRLWPQARQPTRVADLVTQLPDRAALVADPCGELDRWLTGLVRRGAHQRRGDGVVVRRAVRVIDADPARITVGDLPGLLACSASTLYRQFVRHTGMTPKQYLAVLRHRTFTDALLTRGDDGAAVLAAVCGYYDQSHASREFRRHTGMTAGAFRDTYDGIARLMARPAG